MKRILSILLAAAALSACLDVEPFLYRCLTMGFVKADGTFRADDGRIYTFGDFMPDWNPGDRVLVVMDVKEAVNDSVYKASNMSYSYPLHKKPVVVTAGNAEPDTLGLEEICPSDLWYSGGYLNLSARIKIIEEAGRDFVNLMVDKRKESSDTLSVILKHRSDYDTGGGAYFIEYPFYATFPIREYMPAKDSVVLKVSWFWNGKSDSVTAKVEK